MNSDRMQLFVTALQLQPLQAGVCIWTIACNKRGIFKYRGYHYIDKYVQQTAATVDITISQQGWKQFLTRLSTAYIPSKLEHSYFTR